MDSFPRPLNSVHFYFISIRNKYPLESFSLKFKCSCISAWMSVYPECNYIQVSAEMMKWPSVSWEQPGLLWEMEHARLYIHHLPILNLNAREGRRFNVLYESNAQTPRKMQYCSRCPFNNKWCFVLFCFSWISSNLTVTFEQSSSILPDHVILFPYFSTVITFRFCFPKYYKASQVVRTEML